MRGYKRIRAVFCWVFVLVLCTLSGCGRAAFDNSQAESSTSILEADPESLDDITMEGLVSEVLGQMTLEQKIGQLFIVSSRILMELDQLYKRVRRSHKERLAFLQQYPELIKQRDDLILEEITLLNQTGEYEKAKTVLDAHNFHPWEGGEGKVPAQYQLARVELAKKALTAGENKEAISLLEECLEYPHHLLKRTS